MSLYRNQWALNGNFDRTVYSDPECSSPGLTVSSGGAPIQTSALLLSFPVQKLPHINHKLGGRGPGVMST